MKNDPFASEQDEEEEPDSEEEAHPKGGYFPKFRAADFPKHDLTNPSQFRLAVQHIANIHGVATPAERQFGKEWYPRVHDAVAKGIKGTSMSHRAGSGLVAAVSPNMDFEKNNIHAFDELHSLKQSDWDTIHQSASQVMPKGVRRTRSPEADNVLRGMSIATSPDSNLVKAHRILRGEDPDTVLNRNTAPKTNSFMDNITDPHGSKHVTIDGRAHDIAQNEMWPWTYSGRAINSADLPSAKKLKKNGEPGANFGKKTRYENFEDAYRHASNVVGDAHPTETQAITWATGKRIETSFPTKSGAPRVKGVARKRTLYL